MIISPTKDHDKKFTSFKFIDRKKQKTKRKRGGRSIDKTFLFLFFTKQIFVDDFSACICVRAMKKREREREKER